MIGRPGRRRAADERAADRPEHARDRRRRRPPGLSQLGATRSTSASWPSCGTSTRARSRTGRRRRTPCSCSATPSRARSGCCGSAPPTRRSRCPISPGSGASSRRDELLVVVQDLFLTETAELADVVLPGATWGEKTGCFTNADRTVHLSERAVDPPGEARARPRHLPRLRAAHGLPRPRRRAADQVARRRAARSRRGRRARRAGRATTPALSHERLRDAPGIQWPCTEAAPDGTERLYTDGVFNTDPDDRGDLRPGPRDRRARDRGGVPRQAAAAAARSCTPPTTTRRPEAPERRVPAAAHHRPHARALPHPHQDRPRARSCRPPRPTSGSSCSRADADAAGHRRRRPRPRALAARRDRGARRGSPASARATSSSRSTTATGTATTARARAANELTITAWDPVSKQPMFKLAAVAVERVR